MKLTLKDYQDKKFFITPDFKLYKLKEGRIEDIDANISNETLCKINDDIKEKFYIEVENRYSKFLQMFEKFYAKSPNKEYILKAELENVEQITRGKKNPLLDQTEAQLALSPSASISKYIFSDIKRYIANEYYKEKDEYYYIKNIGYGNLAAPYVVAEVLIKYMGFLNNYSTKLKGKSNKDDSKLVDTLEKACQNNENKIKTVKAWFIQNGLCDPDTFIWKDRKKGNKQILANYLYDLHDKGYTKELKQIEIKAIAENSFKLNMSIDLIKQVSSGTIITKEGKFKIPPFSL